ncbi:MAG: Uma2 family endonuclease [Leptolyngbyaceae cyanobacterium MO_188.B28]|nr:Uma2 family endonuclease [Leptolyngbyaceae cyanobacterium MO_188.B28]
MTASPLVLKPISQLRLEPGSQVTVPNVSWQEFESILQEMGEHRSARVAFSKGTLEIVVPLPEHEIPTDLISDMVKTLLRSAGRRYQPFGSTTFKQEGVAGVEPDACFYILNFQRMIGRRRIQPGDPPPDLAIETDVTSKTTLEAYEAIGVPEVWIFDSGQLKIFLLKEQQYEQSETSQNFPDQPIDQLISAAVKRAWQVGNLQALEEFEAQLAAR